jgi:S1-C subfamily serine protease
LTGTLRQPYIVIASEQSLPRREELELSLLGGSAVTARVIGRDPGTNIALLRSAAPISSPSLSPGEVKAGMLVLAIGANGEGRATVRMGIVNLAGPEWTSMNGGRIDRRIVLDLRLRRAEEGGPVLDAAGAFLGISTLGPRAEVLVIPSATIDRIVAALLKHGRIARGWLGLALHPVAVPDALHEEAGQSSGLMVMSIVEDGPAAKAGIFVGDIVLTVNGAPTRRFQRVAAQLGADSIGRTADLRVIRGGAVLALKATIEARPHE